MRGKRARQIKKKYGVQHMHQVRAIENSSQKLANQKATAKSEKKRRKEGESLGIERGKGMAPPFGQISEKGVTRLR